MRAVYPDPARRNDARFRNPPAWNTAPVDERRAAGSIWHVLRRAMTGSRNGAASRSAPP